MDVESGLGVVAVVADQVCLVRSDDDVLEVRERVGELPVDLTLGERPDQSGTLEVRDSHKDTVIGGQTQKESIMGGIIILLTPAPIIDPFPARKPPILMP